MSKLTDNDKKDLEQKELDRLLDYWEEIDNLEPNDLKLFYSNNSIYDSFPKLETFDELMNRDDQREKDGFKKKIKVKKLMKDEKSSKGSVIIVPYTYEEKLIHDVFRPENQDSTGGQGDGEEGDKTGEQPVEQEGDEGGDEGEPGSGSGGEHGVSKDSYELGKELSEKLDLPNLKDKGKKVPIPQWNYDLTDKTRKTGQFLDKQETVKQILKTNLLLGRVDINNIDTTKLIIDPSDKIYKSLSREREYQSQAVVFFIRDYSGSMYGKPTRLVCDLHVMLYTWLIYQYNERVITRFILHDTDAKEVADFNEYYASEIGGGTYICSAYDLVDKIIKDENLERDYNIYIFYGGDGGDWNESVEKSKQKLSELMNVCNRIGISIVKNDFQQNRKSTVEDYMENSGLLPYKDLLRMVTIVGDHESLEEALKYLVSEEE